MLAFPLFLGDDHRGCDATVGASLRFRFTHSICLNSLLKPEIRPPSAPCLLFMVTALPSASRSPSLGWLRCGKRARSVDFGGGVGFYAKIPVKGSNYEATKGDGRTVGQSDEHRLDPPRCLSSDEETKSDHDSGRIRRPRFLPSSVSKFDRVSHTTWRIH